MTAIDRSRSYRADIYRLGGAHAGKWGLEIEFSVFLGYALIVWRRTVAHEFVNGTAALAAADLLGPAHFG